MIIIITIIIIMIISWLSIIVIIRCAIYLLLIIVFCVAPESFSAEKRAFRRHGQFPLYGWNQSMRVQTLINYYRHSA